MELHLVPIETADDVNLVIGQAHFIKTVEDVHEALAGTSSHLRFGLAFCEASGRRRRVARERPRAHGGGRPPRRGHRRRPQFHRPAP